MPEIYFAQIREDSLVERMVAARTNPSKIICIGSGGCTAFSVLNDRLTKMICVDNNAAQCALIELKKAAILQLSRKEFLAFIGEWESADRLRTFELLRDQLPEYAQQFWSANLPLIETGIHTCGATERFYKFVSSCILRNVYEKEVWQQLFNCKSIEEQKLFYEKYFTADKWITAIKILLSKQMHLQFFPAFMFAQADTNDFSTFFLEQFKKEISTKLIRNNYFLSQFISGTYLYNEREGMPFYLGKTGYEQAKRNIHKLEIVNSGIAEACNAGQEIDCFMLSNVFDWCTPGQRAGICKSIEHCKSASAYLMYRSMFASVDLGGSFSQPVKKEDKFSTLLYNTERSMMYRDITFFEL